MNDRRRNDGTDAQEDVAAPSQCPACRSTDVKTTSKVVSAESYWRCMACGEVWNVGRRSPVPYGRQSSYRR